MPLEPKDTLYRNKLDPLAPFEFSHQVAVVFDDMARRSIPHYEEIQKLIAEIVKEVYSGRGVIYDLGCSTGATLVSLLKTLNSPGARLVGVDSSEHMCRIARENLQKYTWPGQVDIIHADIQKFVPENPGLFILNYILQFIPPGEKLSLLKSLAGYLPKGGVIILSEKTRQDSLESQKLFNDFHVRFKQSQGYSDLEISQKREALEKVMTPLSSRELQEILAEAGFKNVVPFFQWFNFACLMAEK